LNRSESSPSLGAEASPSLFGPFQVRVDPWEVDYGSETPLEPHDDKPDEDVLVDVELPPNQWAPLNPGPVRSPGRVFFVDGVRRLETRLVVSNNGQLFHGGFGSFAVGSVEVRPGRASFGENDLGREVILGSGKNLPRDVAVRPNLVYAARSAKETEPDAPLRTIQANMRRAEFHLARRLTDLADTLVVTDGPLGVGGKGNAIGLIKRISELYLPNNLLAVLTGLPAGTRTPLFAIRSRNRHFDRLAWFLRLAPLLPGESELHGLVRLEVAESVGAPEARFLADLTAVLLPRFAPPRARDPRSPQNLLPIGALEQQLRHALGDQRLVRRWIQTLVARETSHARP
jgi:hypothetical protein